MLDDRPLIAGVRRFAVSQGRDCGVSFQLCGVPPRPLSRWRSGPDSRLSSMDDSGQQTDTHFLASAENNQSVRRGRAAWRRSGSCCIAEAAGRGSISRLHAAGRRWWLSAGAGIALSIWRIIRRLLRLSRSHLPEVPRRWLVTTSSCIEHSTMARHASDGREHDNSFVHWWILPINRPCLSAVLDQRARDGPHTA